MMTRGLRVAFVVGTLARGGAEKQLVYMLKALRDAGATLRVCCLTAGEHHEGALSELGLAPIWIGGRKNPLARLAALIGALRDFRPHVVQSSHFYTNLYTGLAARFLGARSIGSIRSDLLHELEANGAWGPWHLRLPSALLANSHSAQSNARRFRRKPPIRVIPNVIDLRAFDRAMADGDDGDAGPPAAPLAVAVGRLVAVKRLDRFIAALARARDSAGSLRGAIIGDGPERPRLEELARSYRLSPGDLAFLGDRDDIPALLRRADMLVLTSDHEGFPNVILEAMAARLPVVTTPAGDAPHVVQDGHSGFVVDFDDAGALAERMARLAIDPGLRSRFGESARRRAERLYSVDVLAGQLLSLYREFCEPGHDNPPPLREAQAL